MTAEELEHAYARALELTERMVEAARAAQWEALVALERERDALVETLRREDTEPMKTARWRERKRDLLARMLSLDEQVRTLTEDWMHELRDILANVSTERKVNKTYQS